jgi:hypothetical protein
MGPSASYYEEAVKLLGVHTDLFMQQSGMYEELSCQVQLTLGLMLFGRDQVQCSNSTLLIFHRTTVQCLHFCNDISFSTCPSYALL